MTTTRSVVCTVCGRVLSDETSIARGYGPECAAKHQQRTALETTAPAGSTVRVLSGSCEGEEAEVVIWKHRKTGSWVVLRLMGRTRTFLHEVRPEAIALVEVREAA